MRTFESEQNHKVQLEAALAIILIRWFGRLMPLISAELIDNDQAFNLTSLPVATSLSALLFTYYQRIYAQFGIAFLRMIEVQIQKIDPTYQKLTQDQLRAFQTELFNQYTATSVEQSNFILPTLQARLNAGVESLKPLIDGVGLFKPSDFLKLFKEEQRRHLRHVVAPDQVQFISEDMKQQFVNFIMRQNAQLKSSKVWETRKDDRVRLEHKRAQSQKRLFNEFYLVDDENLMYPRDPRGSLSNILNCRCASRFSFALN